MKKKIGIVGATGLVGKELLLLLEEKKVSFNSLRLFASERSKGQTVRFRDQSISIELLSEEALKDLDYLFFCSTDDISKTWVPIATQQGICCIDNSSAFRMDSDVPLIVPEINPEALLSSNSLIIANPNCTTIITLMALHALHHQFGLRRFMASSYQAVSGAGTAGIQALTSTGPQRDVIATQTFGEPILNNAIPQIGSFSDNGYTSEEVKMLNESRKILDLPHLKVAATCVRIPVLRAHSVSISAEFQSPISLAAATAALQNDPDVEFFSDHTFPSALRQSHHDKVGVGRLRLNTCWDNALSLWAVGDQIRKGAALNALQIFLLRESK